MSANGIVRIVLEMAGAAGVRAALRGVTDAARQSDRTITQSARDRSRSVQQAERDRVRASSSADQQVVASGDRLSREQQRQERARTRQLREELRQRQRLMQAAGRVAAGLFGAGQAIAGRVEGYQSAIGMPSQQGMISNYIQNEQSLIRLSSQGGLSSDERTALQRRVESVSLSTNTDQGQLVSALGEGQNRFSDLRYFSENLESIARVAQTGGGDVRDYVGALGEFRRQLGLTSEETDGALGSMISMMNRGSIEAGDMSANFSELLGVFHNMRPTSTGLGGAREFMASAETMGAMGFRGPEAATRLRSLMSAMGDSGTQGRLESALHDRNIFDRQGHLTMSLGELAHRAAANPDVFTSPTQMNRIFRDVRSRSAMTALVNADINEANGTGGATPSALTLERGASSEQGNEIINQTVAALMGSTSGEAIHAGIEAQANFSQNGEGLVRFMTALGSAMSTLTTEYPLATEALGAFTAIVQGAGISLATFSMLSGGGGAAAGAAAGAGSTGLAALGAGGAALAIGAPALAIGAVMSTNMSHTGETLGGEVSSQRQASDSLREQLSAGGGLSEFAGRARGMTQEQRAAFTASASSAASRGVSLSPDTIRELAQAIASGTSTSLARGHAADGRTPEEPGR